MGVMRSKSGPNELRDDSPTVRVRRPTGDIDSVALHDVSVDGLTAGVPWREFRWYRKQRHFPGSYWSATMCAPVGYESRLELASLLGADFDADVVWIGSQPCLLEGVDGDRVRRHIPDYLLVREDRSICVLDVKPREMLGRPRVRDSLSWSRQIVEQRGWQYRVESEPEPVRLGNVRFLAGYRRSFQFIDSEIAAAVALLDSSTTVGAAVRTVTPIVDDPALARALVMHLLWRHDLHTDLSFPLQSTSIVEPA